MPTTAASSRAFYKNRHTGIGQYGGTSADALTRIRGPIRLELPVLSRFECDYRVHQGDANQVAHSVKDMDIAYIDPPYNQHPYGSNYLMLNLLVHYRRPKRISRVSGIPVDWQRSGYNVRARSLPLLRQLFDALDARFLLVSFNDDCFIRPEEMQATLNRLGTVRMFEKPYNAYRASRNFRGRSLHVVEHLFLVERSYYDARLHAWANHMTALAYAFGVERNGWTKVGDIKRAIMAADEFGDPVEAKAASKAIRELRAHGYVEVSQGACRRPAILGCPLPRAAACFVVGQRSGAGGAGGAVCWRRPLTDLHVA